jgi:hypothetical protein
MLQLSYILQQPSGTNTTLLITGWACFLALLAMVTVLHRRLRWTFVLVEGRDPAARYLHLLLRHKDVVLQFFRN